MNTTNTLELGNTVVYVDDGREWTAIVQGIKGDTLTVVTVADNGDNTEPHELAVADVVRIAAE